MSCDNTCICAAATESLQSCPTLCDPTDGSSAIPGILQARTLEWVAISLLQCMKVKSESEVAQSCPTLCDPMACSLPGSCVHGILQARIPEWVATAFSVFVLTLGKTNVPAALSPGSRSQAKCSVAHSTWKYAGKEVLVNSFSLTVLTQCKFTTAMCGLAAVANLFLQQTTLY